MKHGKIWGIGVFALALSGCTTNVGEDESNLARSASAVVVTKVPSQNALTGYVRADNVSAVVYTLPNGVRANANIIELDLAGGRWGRSDLTAFTGAVAPLLYGTSAYVRADNRSAVVYESEDGHIRELALSGGAWGKADLTALTNAPLAESGPQGFVRGDGVSSVVYVSRDNHVRELALGGAGSWQASDLTVASGAPVVNINDGAGAYGFVRGDGVTEVIYVTADRHIRELNLTGGRWGANDLTALVNAPLALTGARPYTRSDGVSGIVYFSQDQHVRDLHLAGGHWQTDDLTAIARPPLGAVGYDPIPYVRSDGLNAIVYFTAGRHVGELLLSSSGSWSFGDLTALTGTTGGAGVTPAAYVRPDGVNQVMYYGDNNHIHVFSLAKNGAAWTHDDLTAITGGP